MPEIIVHIKGDDEPRKFTQSIDEVKNALDKKFSQIRGFVSKNNQSDINQAIDSANNIITDPDNRRIFGNLLLNSNPIESVRQKINSFMKHTPYPNPIEGGSDISAGNIAEFGLSASPGVGDVMAVEELKKAISEGNKTNAILSSVGLLPFIPAIGGTVGKNAQDMMKLYHGGNVDKIHEGGRFGGIFASRSKDAASSHGKLHSIDIDPKDILYQSDIDYDLDYDKVKDILKKNLGEMSDDEFDEIYSAVVEDKGLYNIVSGDPEKESRILDIFGESDISEADWKGQKIRGEIAKDFGYKAVEMADEHGVSYLVLPGVDVIKAE